MDNEDFYDSLDEDSTISGATIRRRPEIQPKTITDLDDYVPLYNKEMHVSQVKIKPQARKAKKQKSKIPRIEIEVAERKKDVAKLEEHKKKNDRKNYNNNTSCNLIVLDSKVKRSYVDLFRAKIGGSRKANGNDTTRGILGDESYRTAFSGSQDGSSNFSDAQSDVSDESFYIKFLEDEKNKEATTTKSCCQLKSVSEYSMTGNQNLKKKHSDPAKIATFNKSVVEVSSMGGLGPDRESSKEKLQNLKKQQAYGQKVSNQNRIKMLETQVLKTLNFELRKSSELNKCAESILRA